MTTETPTSPATAGAADTDEELIELPWWYSWWRVALLAMAATLAVVGIVAVATRETKPGEGSVDVGYLQDMRFHHDQAVEMSFTYLNRPGTNAAMRNIARTIIVDQQLENGIMIETLSRFGVPEENSSGTAMAWMDEAVPIERMPGMASESDLATLGKAEGKDADTLFAQLMIAHHEGGIHMAEYAAKHAGNDRVREMAAATVRNQTEEITEIKGVLNTGV